VNTLQPRSAGFDVNGCFSEGSAAHTSPAPRASLFVARACRRLPLGHSTAIVLAWVFLRMGKGLGLNHPPGNLRLRPSLGAANLLTFTRAALTASLAGFLFQAPMANPQPSWEWLPGILYLSASVMDYVDGLSRPHHAQRHTPGGISRHRGRRPGSAGGFPAPRIQLQGAPDVSMGRHRLLRSPNRHPASSSRRTPHRRVAPRVTARWVAGCEMGFAAAALLPIFGPEATRPAAWVMTLALGASLSQDWMIVCGYAAQDGSLLDSRLQPLGGPRARPALDAARRRSRRPDPEFFPIPGGSAGGFTPSGWELNHGMCSLVRHRGCGARCRNANRSIVRRLADPFHPEAPLPSS